MKTLFLSLFFTLTLFASLNARATNYFALTCLANSTDYSVTFYTKWGDNDWQEGVLEAGDYVSLSYPFDYADQNVAPELRLSFDTDMLPDSEDWTEEPLVQIAAPEENCDQYGSMYTFAYDADRETSIGLMRLDDLLDGLRE